MRYFLLLVAFILSARAGLTTDIECAKPEGISRTLDAYVPEGDGPFPTCMLVHGGGFVNGDKTSFIKTLFAPLSQAGFTWFTINYRLAKVSRFPACIEDTEAAIRWVREHARDYKVDPNRIAIIGESAGGQIVSLGGQGPKKPHVSQRWCPFMRRMIWNIHGMGGWGKIGSDYAKHIIAWLQKTM